MFNPRSWHFLPALYSDVIFLYLSVCSQGTYSLPSFIYALIPNRRFSSCPELSKWRYEQYAAKTHRPYRTSYSDPSAKIWGLYLSQAKKLDKGHSESWIENIEGVLVFVRQNFIHKVIEYCTHTVVFSPQLWLRSSSSAISCLPKYLDNCLCSRMGHPYRCP